MSGADGKSASVVKKLLFCWMNMVTKISRK